MCGFFAVLIMLAVLPFIIYENMKKPFSRTKPCCPEYRMGRIIDGHRRFKKSKPAQHKNTTNK